MKKAHDICVGKCTTAAGGNICRGCLRTAEEVSQWFFFTDEERDRIVSEIEDVRRRINGKKDL